MINLIPANKREQITYARRNTLLRHWVIGLSLCLLGLVAIICFGLFYIDQVSSRAQRDVDQGKALLADQKLDETQKRVESISSSLNLVVEVLERQILFSRLITQVGAAIPEGAVLTGLNISGIEGGIDLQAEAINYDTATQVQVNLADPANRIFEKADIINVACAQPGDDGPAEPDPYPCEVSLRALFGSNSQFLLIGGDNE